MIARGEGWREGVIQSYRMRECFEGDGTTLCPSCGGVLMKSTHVLKCIKLRKK